MTQMTQHYVCSFIFLSMKFLVANLIANLSVKLLRFLYHICQFIFSFTTGLFFANMVYIL